jgi:ribonuclease E
MQDAHIEPVATASAEPTAVENHAPEVAAAPAETYHEPLAAPVETQYQPVATAAAYTAVASEERVVEFESPAATPAVATPAAAVMPAAPIAREPIQLPSDLVQIETDTEKLRLAASKLPPPPAPRAPRVRPPLPPLSNEPLIQVETRR